MQFLRGSLCRVFFFKKTTRPLRHVCQQPPEASVCQLAHRAGGDGTVFGPVLCGPQQVQSTLEAQLQEGLQRRGQQNIPGTSKFFSSLSHICRNPGEPLPEPECSIDTSHGPEVLVNLDNWNRCSQLLTGNKRLLFFLFVFLHTSAVTDKITQVICAGGAMCRRISWKRKQEVGFGARMKMSFV